MFPDHKSQDDYITRVFEKIEGRVTKKLSPELSRTENRLLGALAGLDDFIVNPLFQGHSGTVPETFQNEFSTSQGTKEDDSQSNFILKQASSRTRRRKTLAQKMARTWWQEFTRKSLSAPSVHLQESRKGTDLPVNRSSAVRIPLQRPKQTNFCWHFSS